MARMRRLLYTMPAIVLFCSFVVAAPADDPNGTKEMRLFTKVLVAVEQNEAEKVDLDKAIYQGALPGMMRALDPHSNFFDPKEYALLREDQEGRFYGVGMEVTQHAGKTVVTAPDVDFKSSSMGKRRGAAPVASRSFLKV